MSARYWSSVSLVSHKLANYTVEQISIVSLAMKKLDTDYLPQKPHQVLFYKLEMAASVFVRSL